MFWGGVGGVLVFVTAELKTGVADGNLRPHLGKKKKKKGDPSGQFVRKVGKIALELGQKNSIMRVGRASTNKGSSRVGGSHCGSRPARLRKTCYLFCNTDSVRESTRF